MPSFRSKQRKCIQAKRGKNLGKHECNTALDHRSDVWVKNFVRNLSSCHCSFSLFPLAPPPSHHLLSLLLPMSSAIAYMDPLIHQDYQHLFKCLLLGNSGCGKSSIVDRFVDPQHILRTNYITTIGVDFKVQTFLWDGQVVKLQVWVTTFLSCLSI
jgi:hypothetical protein